MRWYAAIAACAAVLAAAVPVSRAVRNRYEWWTVMTGSFHKDAVVEVIRPHSYVRASGLYGRSEDGLATENSVDTGGGDQDMIPGGAYIGGAPDQSGAIMAYQNLMDRFKADYGPDRYPEWYGGAYIDEHAGLIVNIVAGYEPEDKELFFRIYDWAGSDRIGFGSSELSLNQLRELQDKVFDAMYDLGLEAGCGVNEETGQVELTLPAATDEALWKLAELDPAGTAVLVIVGEFISMDSAERPAPSVSHDIQPGGAGMDPNTPVTYIPGVGEIIDTDYKRQKDGPYQTEPSEGGTSPGVPVSNAPGTVVDADGVIACEMQD